MKQFLKYRKQTDGRYLAVQDASFDTHINIDLHL